MKDIAVKEFDSLDKFKDEVLSKGLKCVKVTSYVDKSSARNAIIKPDGNAYVKPNYIFSAASFKKEEPICEEILFCTVSVDTTQEALDLQRLSDWFESALGIQVGKGGYHPDMYDPEKTEEMLRKTQAEMDELNMRHLLQKGPTM